MDKAIASYYLHVYALFIGGDAGSYTNGFPSRLIYEVSFPDINVHQIRLIPEMNFTCHGVITGYTAALRQRDGDQDPIIQIWREKLSQPGSYYKISPGIAINNTLCIGGLTEISNDHEVFHCNLNQSNVVAVQPGDILGLELPAKDNDDIMLAFARVNNGPTSYVFDTRQGLSSPVALSSRDWVTWRLPQITLEIGSGECARPSLIYHF